MTNQHAYTLCCPAMLPTLCCIAMLPVAVKSRHTAGRVVCVLVLPLLTVRRIINIMVHPSGKMCMSMAALTWFCILEYMTSA